MKILLSTIALAVLVGCASKETDSDRLSTARDALRRVSQSTDLDTAKFEADMGLIGSEK